MNHESGAVVIGGHYQGLGVVRSLARKGVRVVVIDSEPCLCRFSRHVTKCIRCPDVRNEKLFLNFLRDLADWEGLHGWVVFPTDDETVFFLSRHRAELDKIFRVTTPEWDIVKFAYDKKQSYQLAEKIGINIPRTFYPNHIDDLTDMDMPFPVIIKPSVMRKFFRVTGKKVFQARNQNELMKLYAKASSIIDPTEILIQEEIPEVASHLYSFCPLFKDKKVLAKISAKRTRQHPMDFGHASTFVETVDIPELQILSTNILSEMDYYGLCEVEFIQDPRDNIFKFLEINPRVWGWHTLAIRAGVDLPYYLYLDQLDRNVQNGYFQEGVKWIRLTTDIPTAALEIMKGRMRFSDYIHSLKGEKEFAVYSNDDILPFFGEFFLLPHLWKKRGF